MSKRVVTAHVPADLAKRLDGLADRLDRPRGWVVKEALEAYVGLAEERHRETLAALRDVDSGRLVEHDEVESWAAGLGGGRGEARNEARKPGSPPWRCAGHLPHMPICSGFTSFSSP